MKRISDQEIKESILDNNPVSSNFLSQQILNDYLLEILSEAGKKDKIFSDTWSLMKALKNLTNIMRPLGRLWAHLDHLKKDNEGVTDLNMLLELVEQCVILVAQFHHRSLYFRRQRVLTALFKARLRVKSLLKEGAHCFKKEQKVLFGERFQKKVNETIKSKKRKQKSS